MNKIKSLYLIKFKNISYNYICYRANNSKKSIIKLYH